MHSYTVRKVNKIKEFEDSKSEDNINKIFTVEPGNSKLLNIKLHE